MSSRDCMYASGRYLLSFQVVWTTSVFSGCPFSWNILYTQLAFEVGLYISIIWLFAFLERKRKFNCEYSSSESSVASSIIISSIKFLLHRLFILLLLIVSYKMGVPFYLQPYLLRYCRLLGVLYSILFNKKA